MTERIRIENTSGKHTPPDGVLDRITWAIDQGLHEVARGWTDYVHRISDAARAQGWRVALIDSPDIADALGYHDLGPDGKPYARIFLDPIFDNGGTWLDGSLSVSAVVSHEVFEMVGDPAANIWANDSDGMLWARELCDAVESDFWTVGDTNDEVALSNFVYPNYFNPWATEDFDYCQTLTAPFSIAAGGYAIYEDGGNIGQTFGADYPAYKRGTKTQGSRTFARRFGRDARP